MSQLVGKNSTLSLSKGSLILIIMGIVLGSGISLAYVLGVLRLTTVFALIALPLLLILFLVHQETILLGLLAVYFGGPVFFPDLVTQGLVRGLFLSLAGIALLMRLGTQKGLTRTPTHLDKILFVWLAIIFFSFIYGYYFKHNEMGYLMGDLYKFVEIILIFWLTTFIVKNNRELKPVIWGFLIMVLIFGAADSLMFFKRAYGTTNILLARVRGPSQFSSIFALLLGVSLILHYKKIVTKLLLAILSFAFLISFILAFLRTGYIALPPTLVFIFLLYLYKTRRSVFAGAAKFAAFVVFLLIFVGLTNVILTRINPQINILQATMSRLNSLVNPVLEDPMGVRSLEIKSIVSDVLVPSPLLGNGLGGQYYGFSQTLGRIEWGIKHYVHNNYFDFLIRTGMVGLMVFLVLVAKYLIDAVKFFLRSENEFRSGVLLGIIGIFVFSCISALSTAIFYSPFLFMMMAATYCMAKRPES